MTNFQHLDRMKGFVSICICKRDMNNRNFDNGAVVQCGDSKDLKCPRADTQVNTTKCTVREKRSIKSLFTYIPHHMKRTEIFKNEVMLR